MTSVFSTPGKYRSRASTSSIPTLVSLEEECTTVLNENKNNTNTNLNNNLTESGIKVSAKPPRRSSLAIGYLGGGGSNDNNTRLVSGAYERRSSIAVASLGRLNSSNKNDSTQLNSIIDNNIKNENNYDGHEKKRRRSSWQAKLERRRKGTTTAATTGSATAAAANSSAAAAAPAPATALDNSVKLDLNLPNIVVNNYNNTNNNHSNSNSSSSHQQKRHSWWNLFVPDNLKQRSRRASQDIISTNNDNLATPPYRRSKSRSVDHGLAAPFDLENLRSKVEGRFESIDRMTRDSEKRPPSKPLPTTLYVVGERDTLTSVAARFDTTVGVITQINRLGSSFIYPGQQLQVPDKSKLKDIDDAAELPDTSPVETTNDDLPQEEKDLLDGLRPGSPKPGHIERVTSPNNQPNNDDDPVTIQRFLKINVRHITDGQGVVGGVLLVTPNAVMFDPNVSDPLVIEHGPESYGVIAPMEFIVNTAIFNDIAHMRVGGGESNNIEKPEIYHPKSCSRCDTHSPGKDSLLVKDETFPELGVGSVEACDDQESVCSSNDREGDAFPKAFERDLVTPNILQRLHGDSIESGGSLEKPLSSEQTHQASGSSLTVGDIKSTPHNYSSANKSSDAPSSTLSLQDRRRSLLDQHWAIPSKDRSLDEEDETTDNSKTPATESSIIGEAAVVDENESLVKLSCHDSGIDMRDPNIAPVIQTKKVYTDADIVLCSEWVPPLTIAPTILTESTAKVQNSGTPQTLSAQQLIQSQNAEQGGRKKTSSVSFSVEDNEQQNPNERGGETKKNKMLKRLSYPLAWVEGLTSDSNKSSESESAPNTGDSNQSVFSKVFSSSPITLVSELSGNLFLSKTPSEDSGGSPVPPLTPHDGQMLGRSSIGTFIRPLEQHTKQKQAPPKLDYRSMVSIDDMPTLFVSFDKLIPRQARACPDPPLYLRLRMGRQIGKTTPLPTTVMSYGKNKLRPEYWFSIPKNKIDELYRFLNSWVPELYGELDEETLIARGYELIQNDTEWIKKSGGIKDGRSNSDGEITEYTRESWELLKAPFVKTYNIIKSQTGSNDLYGCEVLSSMSTDDYRKATLFAPGSFDQDFQIPDLNGPTEILSEEHREKLCGHLPARAEGYAWSLVFSTSLHGFSLNSLYRKMHKLESPILIVIQDTDNNIFGALTSCSLHVSDHFYGTGESLLYKFNPNFKVFHWSGENLYFIKGNPESLAIGAGDGKFGLWLDGDLNLGRSQNCNTYSNEPLAPQEDFVVKTLECWAFV